ncbi:MAG TPA: acetolactate decarboxylase [Leptolinea sp.]
MKKHRSLQFYFLLCISLALAACSNVEKAATNPEVRDTLYQVSTIGSLMSGNYDGIKTVEQISKKGDTGIGTIDRLDGEMLMIDGTVYQVKDSGIVVKPGNDVTVPFAAVTYFDDDLSQNINQVQNLDDLKAILDKMIVKKDRFYAFRIDGLFTTVQVRSVPKQSKPYPVLSEVTKKQAVFNYENIKGSLIGFWCPDYVGSVNVPGYHLHFISDDRNKGGHLLNVNVAQATAMLDETRFFEMELGENTQQNADFTDTQKEIDKVEK